jgi:hypothetical protein
VLRGLQKNDLPVKEEEEEEEEDSEEEEMVNKHAQTSHAVEDDPFSCAPFKFANRFRWLHAGSLLNDAIDRLFSSSRLTRLLIRVCFPCDMQFHFSFTAPASSDLSCHTPCHTDDSTIVLTMNGEPMHPT